MKRYEMFWNDQEARERTEGKWVRYDDARAVIDGLQALLNQRDEQLESLGQVLGEVLVACGMIRGDLGLTGPQLLQFGREFCEHAGKTQAEIK